MWRWEARCPWNNEPVCNLTYMSGSLSHTAATVCLGLTQPLSSTVAHLYFLIQSLSSFVLQSLLFISLFSSTFHRLCFLYRFIVFMRKFIIKNMIFYCFMLLDGSGMKYFYSALNLSYRPFDIKTVYFKVNQIKNTFLQLKTQP